MAGHRQRSPTLPEPLPGRAVVHDRQAVIRGGIVAVIPMAALVAVMIIVSVSTFDWHNITPATLKRMPGARRSSWPPRSRRP
ncbi:hypothetical protein GCM10009661_76090 [Catellatospora chokoriensis]|uniref:Uncharacterized protein n=1 Tax=Catellatospora chokoriensis TaxID=310353 RepID=A0A8J3K894_9ACTN|nr:hypothetical protein Cch02nite_81460 [Catellatospora chokoriensis]